MSHNFHTPIPRTAPSLSWFYNRPMAQLDRAITDMLAGDEDYAFDRSLLTVTGAKTLSSDTLDVANLSFVTVSAETGTADNLSTLVNPIAGATYILQAAAGHTITVKHGVGNIDLNGGVDFVLSGNKELALFYSPLSVATDLFLPSTSTAGVSVIFPRTVLGSAVASISISSIPSTYSHLCLIAELRTTRALTFDPVNVTFNGDTTAANYYLETLFGNSTNAAAAESLGATGAFAIEASAIGSTAVAGNGRLVIWMLNYASTTLPKAILTTSYIHGINSSSGLEVAWCGGDWRNTANAISSIGIAPTFNNIAANSAYELYGLK